MPRPTLAAVRSSAPKQKAPTYELSMPEYVDKWDEYFLYMAMAVSIKSKDPDCRVGAVIVSESKVVLSTGFNGLARGVYDDGKILSKKNEKLKVVCHAEHNAILNAARVGVSVEGASIYVTKFPCLACCNAIIQAGITQICTDDKWFWNSDPFDKNHSRKRSILRQTHMDVVAPFHPEYSRPEPIDPKTRRRLAPDAPQPVDPTKKKGPGRVTDAGAFLGKARAR